MRPLLAVFLLFVHWAHAQETPPALRLPDGVRPLGYQAELTIRPDSGSFSGKLEIELEALRPTPIVWLNASLSSRSSRQASRVS